MRLRGNLLSFQTYAWELYSLPDEGPTVPRKPRPIGSFNIDAYEYPPPFLLLPRALAILTPEFLRFRMVWFALNGTVLVIGLLVVARMLGPVTGTRALLFSPLVLASDITIATLQVGNLQAIVSSLSMIAMVLLAQRRYAAGGALLAYATVSKLFPGLLLVYLVVQRKWRALAFFKNPREEQHKEMRAYGDQGFWNRTRTTSLERSANHRSGISQPLATGLCHGRG
jgi:alpha-1,2-mannosyltransferase